MENKYLKGCFTSNVIRKMQIKTMRYYYITVRMAKLLKLITSNIDDGIEQQKLANIAVGMWNGTNTLEDSLVILTKLNVQLPYNLTITFLDMYRSRRELMSRQKTRALGLLQLYL